MEWLLIPVWLVAGYALFVAALLLASGQLTRGDLLFSLLPALFGPICLIFVFIGFIQGGGAWADVVVYRVKEKP